ncbi:MAG: alpha/beta hydrolase [Proteobacteria bacterium]|nr:alpha/beta hydrolase [Pseudomonadota bacterium]
MRGVSIVTFNPLRERDYAGMLSRIEVPTLIIHGHKDCIVPLVVGQFCASTISNATLSVFENSGHSPFAEEPERFKCRDPRATRRD